MQRSTRIECTTVDAPGKFLCSSEADAGRGTSNNRDAAWLESWMFRRIRGAEEYIGFARLAVNLRVEAQGRNMAGTRHIENAERGRDPRVNLFVPVLPGALGPAGCGRARRPPSCSRFGMTSSAMMRAPRSTPARKYMQTRFGICLASSVSIAVPAILSMYVRRVNITRKANCLQRTCCSADRIAACLQIY